MATAEPAEEDAVPPVKATGPGDERTTTNAAGAVEKSSVGSQSESGDEAPEGASRARPARREPGSGEVPGDDDAEEAVAVPPPASP